MSGMYMRVQQCLSHTPRGNIYNLFMKGSWCVYNKKSIVFLEMLNNFSAYLLFMSFFLLCLCVCFFFLIYFTFLLIAFYPVALTITYQVLFCCVSAVNHEVSLWKTRKFNFYCFKKQKNVSQLIKTSFTKPDLQPEGVASPHPWGQRKNNNKTTWNILSPDFFIFVDKQRPVKCHKEVN